MAGRTTARHTRSGDGDPPEAPVFGVRTSHSLTTYPRRFKLLSLFLVFRHNRVTRKRWLSRNAILITVTSQTKRHMSMWTATINRRSPGSILLHSPGTLALDRRNSDESIGWSSKTEASYWRNAWYPRLLEATVEQRSRWKISGAGCGIHWPDIDEDLSTEGLLRGAPAAAEPAHLRR